MSSSSGDTSDDDVRGAYVHLVMLRPGTGGFPPNQERAQHLPPAV